MIHFPSSELSENDLAGGPDLRDLARRIEGRLRDCGHFSMRRVSCQCRQGELVLSGWAPTFYARQVAQSIVRSVCPDTAIVDRIEVGAARGVGDRDVPRNSPKRPR